MLRSVSLAFLALGFIILALAMASSGVNGKQRMAEPAVLSEQLDELHRQIAEIETRQGVQTTAELADGSHIGPESRIGADRNAKTLEPVANALPRLGLGRPALPAEIAAWDVKILPNGRGLPEGRGDVETGETIFSDYCAACHGDFAEGVNNWPVLAGGVDTLADENPVKTIGSYWPYLSTVWDYVHRSMPFGSAQTLDADQVYAIVAYLLYSNDLVDESFELTHENFNDIKMPNRGGFVVDDRAVAEYPLWRNEPCMENCKKTVMITMRASDLNVTPAPISLETAATLTDGEAPEDDLVRSGEGVFKKCQACHQVGVNAAHRVGPHLNGVFGRVIGGLEDFRYSRVFRSAAAEGQVWAEESMAAFLSAPKKYFQGTKMAFSGLKTPDEVAGVIAYLKTHSD